VFVDIEAGTFTIDVAQVEAAITDRTRAIIPVDLFGQMADMDALHRVAEQHGVPVIEDAAQAIGARRTVGSAWVTPGQLATAATFSFFPSKNLGAWGDGGLIVTNDADRAERLRRLRTHGGAKQYHHDEVGTNSRLDTLQAAVLLAKLPRLDAWNAARRSNAARYDAAFAGMESVTAPMVDQANEHTYHQYTVRADRRDELKAVLASADIGSAVYYPRCLHLQPCFAALGYGEGRLPIAEQASREVLSLPIYPELTDAQQDRVVACIEEFYA
jgi:dTDP-4-amino-4,6-dideoxygalactose transaminase